MTTKDKNEIRSAFHRRGWDIGEIYPEAFFAGADIGQIVGLELWDNNFPRTTVQWMIPLKTGFGFRHGFVYGHN